MHHRMLCFSLILEDTERSMEAPGNLQKVPWRSLRDPWRSRVPGKSLEVPGSSLGAPWTSLEGTWCPWRSLDSLEGPRMVPGAWRSQEIPWRVPGDQVPFFLKKLKGP